MEYKYDEPEGWIRLACEITKKRREKFVRAVKIGDSRASYYEKKLKEPPTCLDDEQIEALKIKALRQRI